MGIGSGIVLVTGGAGLVGRTLCRAAPDGVSLHATERSSPVEEATAHRVELSDGASVLRLFERLGPSLVFHTAYSMQEGERDIWQATRSVVTACQSVGAQLVYMSTDALLDGENGPYDERAAPAPVYEYGRWKARAEAHVLEQMPGAAVVRTSLVTEFDPPDPRTAWVLGALRDRSPVTLFVDELRCPIAPLDLATQLWEVAALPLAQQAGIWHLAGPEAISRYALGLLIAAREGLDPTPLVAALSASSPSPRPRDLRLLTPRADRTLSTRARSISQLALRDPS